MKADQERVKVLLTDTVTLLCRNGLHFQKQLRVQGVLGITVDDTDVFIVHINEAFNEQQQLQAPAARIVDEQSGEPYFMTSLGAGGLPQFTQNPIDGSLQVISGGQVGRVVNSISTNQKHKCNDGGGDDGRSKRQKADPGGQQNQYGGLHGLPGAGLVMQGGKVFSTCTPLPSNEFQGAGAAGNAKDEKRSKQQHQQQQHGIAVSGGGGAAGAQIIQQQHWQFTGAQAKVQADKMGAAAGGTTVIDPTQCYMQYTTAGVGAGGCIDDQSGGGGGAGGGGGGGGKGRKVNMYQTSLSVPTVSFVTGMSVAPVDFNVGGANNTTGGQAAREGGAAAAANNKIWEAQQQQQQQQQIQMNVFDPMTGCAPWAQLMTSHGMLHTDEHQQATQESIQAINQLGGMLGYTTTTSAAAGASAGSQSQSGVNAAGGSSDSAADVDGQVGRGSKESRRSWTSKHKPHTCQHPGCRKSYFFVHDLRRHLRQKHNGMDYNETLGKYEPASEGEGGAGGIDGGDGGRSSPMGGVGGPHGDGGGDTDDGSPDESDDNEEDDVMAMALTGSGGGGKEVAT